jgi:hypothetical protein
MQNQLAEVVYMTEPIICRNGRCRYKDPHLRNVDECLDCDIVEEIEKELLRKDAGSLL